MANLTGGQIQDVMDGLLYHSLEPIIRYTNAFDQQLTYMVHLIISNKKRKPYSCHKDRPLTYIVKALHTDDVDKKLELVRSIKLERKFVYMFIQKFVDRYYTPFMSLYAAFIDGDYSVKPKLETICAELGCKSKALLYKTLSWCHRYLPEFQDYYNSIVNDYMLFCSQQAKASVTQSNGRNYDLGDMKQNFLRNVMVAINKYDCSQGALTAYVKFWIMNARTSGASEHEYGIAYVVPQTKRRDIANGTTFDVNFSISIDQQDDDEEGEGLHDKIGSTEELDGEMDTNRKVERLALLAKSVDPYGVARLVMDLPEVFTSDEVELMLRSKSVKTIKH